MTQHRFSHDNRYCLFFVHLQDPFLFTNDETEFFQFDEYAEVKNTTSLDFNWNETIYNALTDAKEKIEEACDELERMDMWNK